MHVCTLQSTHYTNGPRGQQESKRERGSSCQMDSPVGDRLCFFSSLSIQAWPRALRCEQEKHSLLSDVNYCLERRSILHPADRVSAIRCDFFSRLSERTVRARVLLFYHTASLGWKLGRRLDLREKGQQL